jgi:hypothetical protein
MSELQNLNNEFSASGHVQYEVEASDKAIVWDGPPEKPIELRPAMEVTILENDNPKRSITMNIAVCDLFEIARDILIEVLSGIESPTKAQERLLSALRDAHCRD